MVQFMYLNKGGFNLTCKVLSAKVSDGVKKDGGRYHWCSVWVALDDGSAYEVKSYQRDYMASEDIELAVVTRFGRLDLRPLSEVVL